MTTLARWDGVQDWIVLNSDKEAIGYVHAEPDIDNHRAIYVDYIAFAYTLRGKRQVGVFTEKERAVEAIEKYIAKTT